MYDLIIDTDVQGQPGESPLIKAKALANAELRHAARPDERAWLHTNPQLWLRALVSFQTEVQLHLDNRNLAIAAIADEAARRAEKQALVSSGHFLKLVTDRIHEVRELCGPDQLGPSSGEVMSTLIQVLALLDGGAPDRARTAVESLLSRISKHVRLGPPPDNAGAAPMKVIVYGLRAGTRLNCRACGRGKVNPHEDEPRCPLCCQLHLIER